MITNIDLKTIADCKRFDTFPELFQAIARKLTIGNNCLMIFGEKKILPILENKFPKVDKVLLEDAHIEAIDRIIGGLAAIEHYKKYNWEEVTIGLLLSICYTKIIDKTYRDKHWARTVKIEDWEEYKNRTKDFKSYCNDTTFYNQENIIKYEGLFLNTLTEREKKVYILNHKEGKKYSEIIDLLGISSATIYRAKDNIEIKEKDFMDKIRKGEL